MISLSGVSKAFNKQLVIDNIKLDIPEGEILVILGESGVGKSVLLKIIMGLLKPDRGRVDIEGTDITQLRERELLKVRQSMGYLFQEGALYDFLNVFDNIAFPLREHTRLSRAEIKEKVEGTLKLIDLEGVEAKYPSELSGGMKKRVALARAIVLDSKILLCDEPTSGLDPIRSRGISDLIKEVSQRIRCTTIVTSHDIRNSFRIADRLALIKNGKLAAVGTQAELETSENGFVKEFVS